MMKTELETKDIMAIADAVMMQLAPLLAELKAIAVTPTKPQLFQPLKQPKPNGKAVLNRDEVTLLTGIGKTTLWRLEKSGDFPAKIQLSSGRVGWVHADIMGWIESRTTALTC